MISLTDPGEAFRHGYLLVIGGVPVSTGEGWVRHGAADHQIICHPTTSFSSAESSTSPTRVALIGEPIDVESGENTGGAVARRVLATLEQAGRDAAVRYLAYLGGRFVAILRDDRGIAVVPDCISSVPAYWRQSSGVVWVSSHPNLIAEVDPTVRLDEEVLNLMKLAEDMGTGGTRFIPAPRTPQSGVRPVLANHTLEIEAVGQVVQHRRFYPFPDSPLPECTQAYDQFASLFREHTKLLIRDRPVAISLTAGLDSRTTLFAARPYLGADSFAWSWNQFGRPQRELIEDLLEANRQAFRLRLLHRIIECPQNEPAVDGFEAAFARTFDPWRQHPALAVAVATQMPRGVDHFLSMVAEVGTGFYRNRDVEQPTPERLSSLYSRFPFGRLPEVQGIWGEFMAYGQFDVDAFHGFDYHDIFYWEARIGRWGVQRMQELDSIHRVQLPFNHRGIVEALQALPLEDRFARTPLLRLISELEPRTSG